MNYTVLNHCDFYSALSALKCIQKMSSDRMNLSISNVRIYMQNIFLNFSPCTEGNPDIQIHNPLDLDSDTKGASYCITITTSSFPIKRLLRVEFFFRFIFFGNLFHLSVTTNLFYSSPQYTLSWMILHELHLCTNL